MNYSNNENRIEERVYSVTMTEDELKLFSEFLEQKEFNINHPFNEIREKDASDFTTRVMQRWEEKSKEKEDNLFSKKKQRIVTKPGTSKSIGELTKEEKDDLLAKLSDSEEHPRKPDMIYNIKRFSGLSSEFAAANNLKHNYTSKDIRHYKRIHKDLLKSYEDWNNGLYENNSEYTIGKTAEEIAKEQNEVSKLITNESRAIDLLERNPKKYFKINSKQRKKNAVGDLFGKPRESAKYYSESYQKDFARADYAGLDASQQAKLRAERSELAKRLNAERTMNNESLNNLLGNKKAQSRVNYGDRVNKIGLERNLDHVDSLARSKQLSTQARNNILSQPKTMNLPAKITPASQVQVLTPDKIIPASTPKSLPSVISTSNKVNPALQGKVSSLRRTATMKNMAGKGALLAGGLAATALAVNAFKPKKKD